jgi:hypothetical protein
VTENIPENRNRARQTQAKEREEKMAEAAGCARPTGASVGSTSTNEEKKKEVRMEKQEIIARVGQKAPDFAAPAYYKGTFTQVKLSDFLGKWVMLCFYPGDFTFV